MISPTLSLESVNVVLVNPATDSSEVAASAACYPPLGLISLATVIRSRMPNASVQILDQAVMEAESIIEAFVPGSIVGISTLTTTYRNALSFAEAAWDRQCFVVMGNDHASRFADVIVSNRCVHAVLVGDHVEFPFVDLIRWASGPRDRIPEIPGLVMRDNGMVTSQPPRRYPMEQLPIADRSLVDHSPYRVEFMRRFAGLVAGQYVTPTTVNMCRGCAKVNSRCSFCDIYDLRLDRVSAVRAWKELLYLTRIGLNYIWEVGDSFTSHPKWLDELAAQRPAEFNGELFVYARAQELTRPATVNVLRRIGVSRVNIGMESGDDETLRIYNKGNLAGSKTNRIAARNLLNEGIKAHVSLILGSPGESIDSLARTEDLVQDLVESNVLSSLDVSILYPLPGAPIWRLLVGHPKFQDVVGTDLFPMNLRDRFVEEFCQISMTRLLDVRQRISNLVETGGAVPGGFG